MSFRKRQWIPNWMRRWFFRLLVLGILIGLLWLLRYPILRGFGYYLWAEDDAAPVEVGFVLGGGELSRGQHAAKLYTQRMVNRLIFTGSQPPEPVVAWVDSAVSEADVTAHVAKKAGVPLMATEIQRVGTSTVEECQFIVKLCRERKYKKVAVITSRLHLRRTRWQLTREMEKAKLEGVEVLFFGAPSLRFNENAWWEKEDGLIFVNNEYVKLLYYLVKY